MRYLLLALTLSYFFPCALAADGFGSLSGSISSSNHQSHITISSGFNQLPTRQSLLRAPSTFLTPDSDSDSNPDILEIDNDDDSITDTDELFTHSTNHNNPDTDTDGLTDPEELFTYLTNPSDDDTDADTIPDGWEVDNRLDPLTDDSSIDRDGDSFSNLREFGNMTDPESYPIPLFTGWNLISIGGEPRDRSVQAMLGGVAVGNVWEWQDGSFDVSTELAADKGHWVYSRFDRDLTVDVPYDDLRPVTVTISYTDDTPGIHLNLSHMAFQSGTWVTTYITGSADSLDITTLGDLAMGQEGETFSVTVYGDITLWAGADVVPKSSPTTLTTTSGNIFISFNGEVAGVGQLEINATSGTVDLIDRGAVLDPGGSIPVGDTGGVGGGIVINRESE